MARLWAVAFGGEVGRWGARLRRAASAPSPLRGEGWDEGRLLRRPSWLLVLAGSPGCSPAAGFRTPAGARVPSLCWPKEKEPREMALSSPPTLQALALEVFWNRRDTSCSTFGHTAPSPFTEGWAWVSQLAVLRSLQRSRTAPFSLRGLCPSPSFRRRPESSDVGVRCREDSPLPFPSFPRKRESIGGSTRAQHAKPAPRMPLAIPGSTLRRKEGLGK